MQNFNNLKDSKCLICREKRIYYNFSIGKFRVEECMNCGLMSLNPQPSDAELAAIYSNTLTNNSNNLGHRSFLKSQRAIYYLKLFEEYLQRPLQGELLEIGCGQGVFLCLPKKQGLNIIGIEYFQDTVNVARKKIDNNGNIVCSAIDKILESDKKFDYVVIADVIEHVRNPRYFLQQIHHILSPNGVILIVTPSLNSFTARFMKSKWVEFKLEHLWYFSNSNLSRLLYEESFSSLQIKPAEKTSSFDYIAEHFQHSPVKPYTQFISFLRRIISAFLQRMPLSLTSSGVVVMAKKRLYGTKKLSILMPVYNESNTVKDAINRVLAKSLEDLDIELIIIESKSTDGTREIVRQYETHENVKIVLQEKALGKGHAIREGFVHITGDYVLIQDGDNEYDVEDYEALLEPLISGKADFVLGARHGGGAWKMRHFEDQRLRGHFLNLGHWVFAAMINILFGMRLKDPFTMYKVFRKDCLRGLKFECNRFDFDIELLLKLVKSGYRPIEIPVNYRSRSFAEGKKVSILHDPFTWLKAILKCRFERVN